MAHKSLYVQTFSCKVPGWVYHEPMKHLSFFLLFLTACSTPVDSSVVSSHFPVETETTTYDFVWPVLAEGIEAPQIAELLTMESVLVTTEEELEGMLQECNCGYVSTTYEVNYDKDGLLSLTIWSEFVGAYLHQQRYDLNFDLGEDRELTLDDLILPEKKAELLTLLDAKLQANIQANEEDGEGSVEAQQNFSESDLENFILTEEGMEWWHAFGFGQAFKAGEPEGVVKMSNEELRGFLKS